MARKKLVETQPGEIFAIPLFASNIDELKRFAKKDHAGPDRKYAFMRVIEDRAGSGIICEVFDLVGDLKTPVANIVASSRLFRPISVSGLGIYKKRWPAAGRHDDYDRERDSGYSEIALVLSPFDEPVLWKGGAKASISKKEVAKYEPWTIWGEQKLENRIIAALKEAGKL